jgi:CarboxypepD_reg-like domain
MRVLLLLACCLVLFASQAQKITLSARVQDNQTNEPLPFASVGIKGKPIGTVTNLQGEFDFHILSEYRNEILVISMLGYENFEAPVWSILENKPSIIPMIKSTTMLQEVEVRDSLSGGEILQLAMAKIDQNFPMEPFMLEGFYRDVKKVGGTYIALLEAAVKIYDESYVEPRNKSKLRERVKLVEVRKSVGYDNKFTAYFGQRNLLEDLLLHNNIRYRQIDLQSQLLKNTIREKDSYYNGHAIFVVTTRSDFFLKVYIDKSDYSIMHLQFEISGDNDEKKGNLTSNFITYNKTIDFKRYNGKMYLNYITVISKEKWIDRSSTELQFETELEQHLLINDVQPKTTDRIGSTEKMRNYGLQYQDYPYNKSFWDNYNVIKETPVDRKILEDLEKIAPMEKQFEEN